ncbi:MAG: biotin--[acetyl-CoA-carboxylase] ligase [Phycisphaerales bacterium]
MTSERADFDQCMAQALSEPGSCVSRFTLLDETPSTQDAARELCRGEPGLLVVALRQTHGRGRLGRVWADTSHLGLAATFVLPGSLPPDVLSIACGLAAARVCSAVTVADERIGVRWPNDVVARREGERERKLAGVLIERADNLYFAGIGINVLHTREDFPPDLRDRAASLSMLGAEASRAFACVSLTLSLSRDLELAPETLASRWQALDMLIGSVRTFEHDNKRHTGTVTSIDPRGHIVLATQNGTVTLPALTTSMVHDGAG